MRDRFPTDDRDQRSSDTAEPSGAGEPLTGVRRAIDQGHWENALALLEDLGDSVGREATLELRARAAYGAGGFEASIVALEELHGLLETKADAVEAGRIAATIALHLLIDTGMLAPVRGWLRRAERSLEGHDEAPALATIAMVRAYERLMCGDLDSARTAADLAVELGTRLDVASAVVIGRVAGARVDILEGHVEDGLEQLDEIATLLMSGTIDPLTTGIVYCELICAAQGLFRYDRAREWTDVMERWRHGAAFDGLNGRCRVHRAELLRVSGPGAVAEQEAIAACDELRPWMRREFGWPLVELGTIRLRRGDLTGAEEAFTEAHRHAWSPHPGLALLRFAQGEVSAAATLIADAIAHPLNFPSKEQPPFGDLRLAPLLEAQVEIAVAAADTETARCAADGLGAVAQRYPSPWLCASAALARSRVSLADSDPDGAAGHAARALAAWTDLGAPFEAARARLVLGDAHHAAGRTLSARVEWETARSSFQAFGAALWARLAAQRLTGNDADSTGGPHSGPAQIAPASRLIPATAGSPSSRDAVWCYSGGTRTVSFAGTTVVVRDLKGFRYLEWLLAEPGREFHVLDLVARENGTGGVGNQARDLGHDSPVTRSVSGGLPMLDEAALSSYRRRLAEIDQDIDEADRINDLARAELARADREYLVAEIARSVGLGGRHRTTGDAADRARMSVARSIRYALDRLEESDRVAAAHLRRCVRTGTYCRYEPDPVTSFTWHTTATPPER